MKDEVVKKAKAHLDEMEVEFDQEDVSINENKSVVQIKYKDSSIELPVSQSVVDDAVKYIIGAAIFAAGLIAQRIMFARGEN